MNNLMNILSKKLRLGGLVSFLLFLCLTTMAQDKENLFNPEYSAVTSQTIAPDARSAGMGDVGAATPSVG